MKLKRLSFAKLRRLQSYTPVLVVGILMATGAVIYNMGTNAAAPGGFSFASGSTSYKVGDTFNVDVIENSGGNCANVVQAEFTYPANLLRFNSSNTAGSKFESALPSNSGNGTVSLQQYTTRKECFGSSTPTSGVSGEQRISTVSFTVIGSGTATLTFNSSSTAISSADNRTNVAPGFTNRSFSLAQVVAPQPSPPPASPPPAPGPAPTPPPPAPRPGSPAPRPSPTPSTPRPPTTSTPSPPTTSFTPVNTDTSVPVGNTDVIEVGAPVDVNPLPIQPDGVDKIEYYLDKKLVATVKTPPYKYRLDTTKLLNGKYTMTTKTFYSNGQSKSVSQTVVVNNPFGIGQILLWLKKMAWLIVLLIVLIGAAIAFWVIRGRGGSDDYYDDGTYEMDGTGGYEEEDSPVIAPNDPNASQAYGQSVMPDYGVQQPVPSGPQAYQPQTPSWQQPQPATPPAPQAYGAPAPYGGDQPEQTENLIRPTQPPPQN